MIRACGSQQPWWGAIGQEQSSVIILFPLSCHCVKPTSLSQLKRHTQWPNKGQTIHRIVFLICASCMLSCQGHILWSPLSTHLFNVISCSFQDPENPLDLISRNAWKKWHTGHKCRQSRTLNHLHFILKDCVCVGMMTLCVLPLLLFGQGRWWM